VEKKRKIGHGAVAARVPEYVFAVRRSQIEGVQLRSCGERCAQVVFVQVIANEINQQIPVRHFIRLASLLHYHTVAFEHGYVCTLCNDALRPLLTTVRSVRTMRLHVEAFRAIQALAPIGTIR